MQTIHGFVVPREGVTAEQLKALLVRLGEWIWAEEKHGIGILFDINALTDVRDGKMPRTTNVAAGSVPVVPFGAGSLADEPDLPEGNEAFLRRAADFFDPAIVSAIALNASSEDADDSATEATPA